MISRKTTATVAREIFDTYSEAMISGDAKLFISLWDEHAVRMPPGKPALFGKAAIEDEVEFLLRNWNWEFAVNTEEVRGAGHFIVVRGTYLASVTEKKGEARGLIDSKFLAVLREQAAGQWKISHECFNSNLSAGGSGPVHDVSSRLPAQNSKEG